MANIIKDPFKEQLNQMLGRQTGEALGTPINRNFAPGWQGALGAVLPPLIGGVGQLATEYGNRSAAAHGLNQGFGVPKEQANALAYLPQDQQNLFLEQGGKLAQAERTGQAQNAKLLQNEIKNRFEYNKENIKDYINQAKASREAIGTLDRMEELSNTEGELSAPGTNAFVGFLRHLPFGFDIDGTALLTPGSQEFEKLQTEFLRNMSKVFGGRVAVQEMQAFMRGVPNLMQNKEGRLRVIKNLKTYYKSQALYDQAAEEIIEKSGGVPPYDLNIQVERAVGRKLDKLAEKFEVPKSKLVSAKEAAKLSGMPIGNLQPGDQILNNKTGETITIQ